VSVVGKIVTTNVVLIIVFVVTGVILAVTGNTAEAHGALGTATGLAIGTGSATVIVNASTGKNGLSGDTKAGG
jgi:hypothetical protein